MSFLSKVFPWLGHGRYKASPTAVGDGQVAELLTDAVGRLRVLIDSAGPSGATPVRQLAGAKKGTLKAGAGSLLEVSLWNSSASPVWFQVHNKASDPANGETCVDQVLIPAGGSLGWRPMVPVACGTQVRWAASSTPGTLTLIAGLDVGFSGAVL